MKMKSMFVVLLFLVLQYSQGESEIVEQDGPENDLRDGLADGLPDGLQEDRHHRYRYRYFSCLATCTDTQYCRGFRCYEKKEANGQCGRDDECQSNRCVSIPTIPVFGRSLESDESKIMDEPTDMVNQEEEQEVRGGGAESRGRYRRRYYYRRRRYYSISRCQACVPNGCPSNAYCKTWVGSGANAGVGTGTCLLKKANGQPCRNDRQQVCINRCVCPAGSAADAVCTCGD